MPKIQSALRLLGEKGRGAPIKRHPLKVISGRSGAFKGSHGANVRTGSAVGTEVRIDLGTPFPGGDSVQGTDRQAIPAVGAFFGNLVRHFFNSECGIRNAELQ
jgi:hypothetical protein